MIPSIIRGKILDLKESPTVTNDFPSKLWKLCLDVFTTLLRPLFCSIVRTRPYPEIWKSALMRPAFKNGAKKLLVFYRAISLLPKCSLGFEKLVYRHNYSHVWMKIHPRQFGFQSRKNSVLELLDYLEFAHRMRTLVTYPVYLDYEKAFDKVPHTILLSKIRTFGLDESFMDLLSSYLKDRIQNVKLITLSPTQSTSSGVPQGSVLVPFFFSLFLIS